MFETKGVIVNKSVVVLLTGIGGGGHGEQVLKALHLARTNYVIVGTDISPIAANRNKVDYFHVVPPATHDDFLVQIIEIANKYKAKVLIHGSEPEMVVFSKNKSVFEDKGIYVPVNPLSVIDICQDKTMTSEFLRKNGFDYPQWCYVDTLEDAMDFNVFPAILKPAVGGGGSANVFIVQDRDELAVFARHLLGFCEKLIVQEYIGDPSEEYTVGVLFGRNRGFN